MCVHEEEDTCVSDEEEDTFSLQTLCMCVQFSRVSLCVGNGGLWRNIYIYEVCFPLILGLVPINTVSPHKTGGPCVGINATEADEGVRGRELKGAP